MKNNEQMFREYWDNKDKFCYHCYDTNNKLVEVNKNTDNGYYTPGDVDKDCLIRLCDNCIIKMGYRIRKKNNNINDNQEETQEKEYTSDKEKDNEIYIEMKEEDNEVYIETKEENKCEKMVDETNELEKQLEWLK